MLYESDWEGLLKGRTAMEQIFRGLVICKLCGDNNFEDKLTLFDRFFYAAAEVKQWIPFYEKLKQRLEQLEAKYSSW